MNLEKRTLVFKALGNKARLKMVDALGGGELCVCDLVDVAGLRWPTVSRHLSVLKAAGIVADEKRGKQVFYRLSLCCIADMNRCLEGKGETACGCAPADARKRSRCA